MTHNFKVLLIFIPIFFVQLLHAQVNDTALILKIISIAKTEGKASSTLRVLTDSIGGRITGTPQSKKTSAFLLEKLKEIARKQVHAAPHETLLVLDATTGQNALSQAKHFKDSVNISGIVLTKLDGTAKGGMVFAISKALGVPVRFVGTGEKIDDLMPFDAEAFVDGLFDG